MNMYEALLYLFAKLTDTRQDNNKTKIIYFLNCCFTVHFDKFKAFLPTNALFIKTQNPTAYT
jgi:hypothetical protein